MKMQQLRAMLVMIGVIMCAAASPVTAQSPKKNYEQGLAAYNAGQFESARVLYGKACDGGVAGSCANLGLMLKQGEGGAKDLAKAKEKFAKACQLGLKEACGI
jgi:uncharacterized protein